MGGELIDLEVLITKSQQLNNLSMSSQLIFPSQKIPCRTPPLEIPESSGLRGLMA